MTTNNTTPDEVEYYLSDLSIYKYMNPMGSDNILIIKDDFQGRLNIC
jgi:hypothetical protein